MNTLSPRVVIVTRETDYELLLARHATRDAIRFHLQSRGQRIERVDASHAAQLRAEDAVRSAIPRTWRQARVRRSELDRFLFGAEDLVVAIGQDGLIANLAKYVSGQPVIGVNPDPATIDGVLARIGVGDALNVLQDAAAGRARIESRTMVEARLDNGASLVALNEIFIGHRSHQSARYVVSHGSTSEQQSSSGLIVSTGTGATGWARSIMKATSTDMPLDPGEPVVAYFVREAWPSKATATTLVAGRVTASAPLNISSRMEGGVLFADGIERDFLPFDWGVAVAVAPARQFLNLVVG